MKSDDEIHPKIPYRDNNDCKKFCDIKIQFQLIRKDKNDKIIQYKPDNRNAKKRKIFSNNLVTMALERPNPI